MEALPPPGYVGKRHIQLALDSFHAANSAVGVALNVTRRPFSFAGSRGRGRTEAGGEKTWLWRDGLAVYAGDALEQQLLAAGLPRTAVAALRSEQPWRVAEPHRTLLMQALGEGQRVGLPGAAELRRLLTSEEEGQKYGGRKAKGKTITPADEVAGQGACRSLGNLGHSVDIAFDFDTEFSWHPVDSQRLLLWATKQGKAEELMSEFNVRHFERRESVNVRANLLAAAAAAGLDPEATAAFLDTDDLKEEVWASYEDTIANKNIHAIPYFVFTEGGRGGGPFREGGGPHVTVRGSADVQTFVEVFNTLSQAATA